MLTQRFALILGVVFLVVGAAGFISPLLAPADREISVDAFHGLLFGLFPVNILHNLFHLAFGVWGVIAYRSFGAARTYARVTAVIYAVLIVMGLVPGLDTTFGLIPLYGHDIWLHFLIAAPAAYFGFFRSETAQHARRA